MYVQLTFCKNEHAVITLKIALIVIVLIYTSANTNSTRLGLLFDGLPETSFETGFKIQKPVVGSQFFKVAALFLTTTSRVENDERTNAGLNFTLMQLICHNDC